MIASSSTVFPTEEVGFRSGPNEFVIIGGREKFTLVHEAFRGISQIAVIGWGSQGPAQAQNVRDTLKFIGSKIKVAVGLREGSSSVSSAKDAGFSSEDGAIGEMYDVISKSDIVALLISDGAQTENYERVFRAMKPGATLLLSHGFLHAYLVSVGHEFRPDINVVMVAPKGMGPSVRRLYLQGLESGGSGINSSVAVYQDVTGYAYKIALGWSVAIGSPVTFNTTIQNEVRSDLFGERAILLGGLWGLSEALYHQMVNREGYKPEDAFKYSAIALTDFVSPQIAEYGLDGYWELNVVVPGYEKPFFDGYSRAYEAFGPVMADIYESVASGDEVLDVVRNTAALKKHPMESIEGDPMWQVGGWVREGDSYILENCPEVAFAAGAYIGGIMVQFELLQKRGHCVSEIINESLIEATDSLNPFMSARGVAFMVDNCSTTARLGARKWGPVFRRELTQSFGLHHSQIPIREMNFDHPIHDDVRACYKFKPKQSIAVV